MNNLTVTNISLHQFRESNAGGPQFYGCQNYQCYGACSLRSTGCRNKIYILFVQNFKGIFIFRLKLQTASVYFRGELLSVRIISFGRTPKYTPYYCFYHFSLICDISHFFTSLGCQRPNILIALTYHQKYLR